MLQEVQHAVHHASGAVQGAHMSELKTQTIGIV